MILGKVPPKKRLGGDLPLVGSLESLETMSDVLKYDDHDAHDDDRDYNFFLEDDGCEPMKGPRSEPQMMSMHEEHKKIEVGNPLN